MPNHSRLFLAALFLFGLLTACTPIPSEDDNLPAPTATVAPTPPLTSGDEWSLWSQGTHLRGANIYQRRVFPELDGTEFLGPGPFGPPYTQEDFDRLSALGANYVNLSVPGLFNVAPPYNLDEEAQANLDHLLAMAANADLFAVITFRTGPGRSEFAIIGDINNKDDWLPDEYIINTVWEDPAAQDAWVEMWRYTAARYAENPIVVGYDLMCEPNSNALFDLWDPAEFEARYSGTTYDWDRLYPRIAAAIRAVDPSTPILIGGNGYSVPAWLEWMEPVDEARIVYTFHQYEPHRYTHQELSLTYYYTYPGEFDTDYDGDTERFDHAWLADLLSPSRLTPDGRPGPVLAVNEYGLVRWAPFGPQFLQDEMEFFEQYGWNYAVWQWYPAWEPLAEGDNAFNLRFGPDPERFYEVDLEDNVLLQTLTAFWSRNTARPSNFGDH
jgi:hypothetical protein